MNLPVDVSIDDLKKAIERQRQLEFDIMGSAHPLPECVSISEFRDAVDRIKMIGRECWFNKETEELKMLKVIKTLGLRALRGSVSLTLGIFLQDTSAPWSAPLAALLPVLGKGIRMIWPATSGWLPF